jgi:hypothetical protein
VDELAHLIQDDADSAWPLASRGEDALGALETWLFHARQISVDSFAGPSIPPRME